MTTIADILSYLIPIAIAAAVSLWFFVKAWPTYCTDVFRQRCFELRDSLFMLAATGKIKFDDPIYVALRSNLNSRLRLAHMDMIGSILAIIIAFRGRVPASPPILLSITALPDDELRDELQSIYWQIIHATLVHIIVKSPIVLALITILLPFVLLIGVVNGGLRVQRNLFERLSRVASDDYGEILPQSTK